MRLPFAYAGKSDDVDDRESFNREAGSVIAGLLDPSCKMFDVTDVTTSGWFAHCASEAVDPETLFPPAPLTWMETTGDQTWGWLAQALPNDLIQKYRSASDGNGYDDIRDGYRLFVVKNDERINKVGFFPHITVGRLPERRGVKLSRVSFHHKETQDVFDAEVGIFANLLEVINGPRRLEYREAPPHVGLEKDLRRAGHRAKDQRSPPWTMLKLSTVIMPVIDVASGPSADPGGSKIRHICRSHLRRYRSGKTVTVKAHWRGDETKGTLNRPIKVVA